MAALLILVAAAGCRKKEGLQGMALPVDGGIEALCRSVLDEGNDSDRRCHDASLLRLLAEGEGDGVTGSARGFAQFAVGAHIIANCSGLGGELLASKLDQAERDLMRAAHSPDSQIVEAARKGLLLIPSLRKTGLSSEEGPANILGRLGLESLVPPRAAAGGSKPAPEGESAVPKEESTPPDLTGIGLARLLPELNARYGLRFKRNSFTAMSRDADPSRQLILFQSQEQVLTGLSGDAVTQGDMLVQIALRVKISGNSHDNAADLLLFGNALQSLEDGDSSITKWVLEKARVALLEPERSFVAKTTIDNAQVTLKYRERQGGFTRPSLAAEVEDLSYFQWQMSQRPVEVQRPAREHLQ